MMIILDNYINLRTAIVTQKKYQIFVSSTFRDLVEERQDALKSILDLKHIPAGMELFPAADVDQLEYIKKIIDECDYYLLIIGGRYGSVDSECISYTEREYDYAVEQKKFVLAFVHDSPEMIPSGKSDSEPTLKIALSKFREKVESGRLVRGWKTRQDLALLVLKALVHAITDHPQVGWIRGDAAASDELLQQSNNLLQENAKLKSEVFNLSSQKPANIADIAELDDIFEIRCSRIDSYTKKIVPFTAKIKWRDIFLAVAATVEKPIADLPLGIILKEKIEDLGIAKNARDINETAKARIKVQLIALGLIRADNLKTTTGGVSLFYSLTPLGQKKYIEEMVVRKPT